jgi:predicted N-acyltransferase
LRKLGYFPARSLPSWSLPVAWRSWDEYLASLRAGYRRQVRTTLSGAHADGLRARTVPGLPDPAEDVVRLYDRVMERARYRMEWLPPAFFEALGRNLPGETRTVLLEREERAVACAVMLHGPRTSTFLVAGVDWDDSAAAAAYPCLVLQVVKEAIRAGARRLELGQTSDGMKSRVGAGASPRWVYLRHRGAWRHRVLDKSSGLLFPEQPVPARRVFAGAR